MNKAIILAVLITATTTSTARAGGESCENISTVICFNDSTQTAIPGAKEMLLEIIRVTGLQPNFELKEADVANIEASVSRRKRYILYNPEYIERMNRVTHDKWASMALFAHEVGHHLNGHTIRKSGSKPNLELEADEFAGFILCKLGASLEKSQEVMKYIAGTKSSGTHPGRTARMLAIEKGWNRAAEQMGVSSR
jgi:hypothetical protein